MSDDAPTAAILAGQLEYLFDDDAELRTASDVELAERLSRQDRYARAREKYPILSDDEIREHIDEFEPRITPELVREARARMR